MARRAETGPVSKINQLTTLLVLRAGRVELSYASQLISSVCLAGRAFSESVGGTHLFMTERLLEHYVHFISALRTYSAYFRFSWDPPFSPLSHF